MVRGGEIVEPPEYDRYRVAVRKAVARSTRRRGQERGDVARLQKLLDGANLCGRTRKRLRFWYFRETSFGSYAVEDAAYILPRLVGTLPAPDHGVANLLAAMSARTSAPECARRSGCGWLWKS